ncbi:aldo/keto reductase [Nitrospira defluvii]|uniref:Thymidylate kinase n=1 Tax=Nitrospira defluvii TaxID=330214 RepID=A0ABN7LXP8_9BACT|nr:aldo/keto reductase [Nitrospira defluvii]CAE6774494.1 Thymidylate kinase [Nitrospira defluvii]
MTDHTTSRAPNRLIHETSPYLLQHAYNPVEWYPWGPEALAQAATLNRPILLSIGYSSCHWCHVMERESFENEATAALMNRHFVCIKVDREERPDLDEIYMQATLALNRNQGGWPMTVFLTPDQTPFFAGTYFPPSDRYGRPGFPTLLKKLAEYWEKDRDGVVAQAANLTARLRDGITAPSPTTVGEAELDLAVTQFAEDFDATLGGFGGAPKFPPATGLSLLLRCYHRTKDPHTLTMVRTTLDAMAAGGIYDHIGGGFARYSTDDRWLVPHFEKMLYDNALLAHVYVEAYQVTGHEHYRRVACETLDYILKEMTSSEGGFYSATDADSEGVEGKFFVWTPDDVRAVLQDDEAARRVCAYYDVSAAGNWEHTNVLHTAHSLETVAKDLGLSADELRQTIEQAKPKLYAARGRRTPPGLDDKVITAWNGMMIRAMAEAGRVFDVARYREAAQRACDFLLTRLSKPDGRLLRTYRAGTAHLDAYLEDYAYFAEGLIETYEAGGQERYLLAAVRLAEYILADFADEQQGGFFTTAIGHEALILRSREGPDGATPSGNAVAASVLARLSFHFAREDFRQAAAAAVRAYGRQIARYPRAFAKSLIVVDLLTNGPAEIAVVGAADAAGTQVLRAAVNRIYVPNRVLAHQVIPDAPAAHPLLQGKTLVDGQPALYVCRNFSCRRPITDPAELPALLDPQQQVAAATSAQKVLSGSLQPGHATAQGTATYAARHIHAASGPGSLAHGFGPFGATGLTVSRLGFGTYRVGLREAEQREALIKAIRSGCNLIDTSTNYMDGESEQLVGSVLQGLIRAGDLAREAVVVVSKIGYVQGQNLTQAQAREKSGKPYPEMVKYGDDIWHCIHPDFLADQLTLSLDRLGLATLDVCLLHNPEYFLSHAAKLGGNESRPLPELRVEFYRRLQRAFEYLEGQVQAGRLRGYGVSSNTSTAGADEPGATSLSRMIDAATLAAHKAGISSHHFTVLQCPMNLYESGAALVANTGPGNGRTLLEEAMRAGIAVLVNRPLNAMPAQRGGVVRLADVSVPAVEATFDEQRQKVATLEEEYRTRLAPAVAHSGQGMVPSDFFRWADELNRIRTQIQGLEHWEQIEQHMIAPHVNQVLRALAEAFTGTVAEQWESWRDRYVPELLALLRSLQREAAERSRLRTEDLHRTLNPLLPEARRAATLSQKCLWVLRSTAGVTSVLVGMRSPAYVDDALQMLRWDALSHPQPVYETCAGKK